MFVSIIIPTCNRNDLLKKCLDCLLPQAESLGFSEYEIIVTDDSKGNDTKDLLNLHYPLVRWVKGPQKGPAANRNNGVAHARGDWLLFTDDDCLPQQEWIKAYSDAIKENRANVLEGQTIADRPKESFNEVAPVNVNGGNLWSCNFAIKKESFVRINGFDENFPYAALEDTDFFVRIKQKEKIVFIPNASVIHPWRSMKAFANYRKWLISNKYFNEKHKVARTSEYRLSRIKIFISHVFLHSKELVKYSLKGSGFYFENILFDFLMIFI